MHGIRTTGNIALEYAVVASRQTVKDDIGEESWKNLSQCMKTDHCFP